MRIARVQADGSGMTDLTSPAWPARDLRALWSPEGTRIAFASTTGQIGSTVDLWVSDVDGSDKRLVVENARPLSWRPYHG
jgi:Tol biopolymer transport system component